MPNRLVHITVLLSLTLAWGCNPFEGNQQNKVLNLDLEKSKILECLNNETKSAFARNYDLWTQHWIHRDDVSKTYINFVDSTFSESIGWSSISSFVHKFIEEHPKPEPPPKLLDNITVQLYENGAWVSYEQMDSLRGLKRETRLMEKEDGTWKIAGMHTTIYGFNKE